MSNPEDAFELEVTDTYGGQANYCWVNRTTLYFPENTTRRQKVIAMKREAGWTGLRCEVYDCGDYIEIRPRNLCQVAFLNYLGE